MSKKKPFFIVFEGIEGCGKSFQSKKLYNNLIKKKFKPVLTREPGGTKMLSLLENLFYPTILVKREEENLIDTLTLYYILPLGMSI